MSRSAFLIIILLFAANGLHAQYAPQAGLAGSDAISAGSSKFIGWATGCTIQRGYMDIAKPSLGYASLGDSSLAIGVADGNVVSLGDSGIAVLTFNNPIYNGAGPDFAVFENGFRDPADSSLAFLELGFVEVSSDGINYFRFPPRSLTQDTQQVLNGTYLDAKNLHNLAGKYIGQYGTPFDLDELAGITALDVNNITHIRIVDVIGSINGHATYDSAVNKINDPYPTPFPSCGFDLDAVGVVYQKSTGVNVFATGIEINMYPNPVTDKMMISFKGPLKQDITATLKDMAGKILIQQTLLQTINEIPLTNYVSGIYFIELHDATGNRWVEKIIKL